MTDQTTRQDFGPILILRYSTRFTTMDGKKLFTFILRMKVIILIYIFSYILKNAGDHNFLRTVNFAPFFRTSPPSNSLLSHLRTRLYAESESS